MPIPIITSALFVLKTSYRCLPRLSLNTRAFRIIRGSDSDSGRIMFYAIVLITLAYALAIGWTKTKTTSKTRTAEAEPASGH